MIELTDHPYFVGCQFHPEFKSKPFAPHPLFSGFIQAALDQRDATRAASAGAQAPMIDARRAIKVGPRRSRCSSSPGPDVIESEELALRHARLLKDIAQTAGRAVRLQVQLRQGQPHQRQVLPRPRPGGGPARSCGGSSAEVGVPVLTDVHDVGAGRRPPPRWWTSCRSPPSSAGRRTWWRRWPRTGRGREPQEGPVRGARGHRPLGAEGRARRATPTCSSPSAAPRSATTTSWWTCAGFLHDARGRPGRVLRRHPLGAAALAPGDGETAGERKFVSAAGPRGRRRRHRRALHRGARGPRPRAVRRPLLVDLPRCGTTWYGDVLKIRRALSG